MAQGGTVYFDEIAALAPPLQAKLLRAIQEKRFTRLGGTPAVAFDGARDLVVERCDDSSALRRDLLLPHQRRHAARSRRCASGAKTSRSSRSVSGAPQARDRRRGDAHCSSSTTGRATSASCATSIERAVLVEESDVVTAGVAPAAGRADLVDDCGARRQWTLDELEARYIREILPPDAVELLEGRGEILGINRKTLLEKRKKYGIE